MSEFSKKIAEYIRLGWKLSTYHCPVCNNPIVSKGNRYYCAVCEKDVKVVKDEAEYRKVIMDIVLEKLKTNVVASINQIMEVEDWIYDDKNLDLIIKYLDILLKVNKVLSSY